MSSSKPDTLFVTSVTAVFVAALVLALCASSVSEQKGRVLIGTVTYKDRYAERKLTSQVMWNALAQNSPVYNGDTIHTTAGASAVVHLDSQTDIRMGEETLVRLDVTPQSTEVRLDGGIISVRSSSSDRTVRIDTADGKISTKGGDLSVQDRGDTLQLSVAGGGTSLEAGKGSMELSEGTSLYLRSGVTQRPVAQLLEPQVGSTIYRASGDSPTQFRWAFNSAARDRDAQAEWLIIAADSEFEHVEATQAVSGSEAAVALGAGTHYWKIQGPPSIAGASANEESTVGYFHILRQDSPLLIEPQNRRFDITQRPPLVPFSWSGVTNASAYRLSIVHADTGAVAFSRVVGGTSICLDELGKGDYSWSVSAMCGPDNKEFASPSALFKIVSGPPLPPKFRALVSTDGQAGGIPRRISEEALRRGATIAAWGEMAGADYYEARISKDPKGTAQLAQTKTVVNAVSSPIALAPGDYYLQVRSFSGAVPSDFSEALPFTVTSPQAIIALDPPDDFSADPELRNVLFRWSDPNDSGHVRLQLSTEPTFAHPLLELPSSADAANVRIPDGMSGEIYWRLVATSAELGQSSAVRYLRMPDRLSAPRITWPAEGLVLDISATETLRLGWEVSAGANQYMISLYQQIGNRSSPVQSWESSEPFVSIPRLRQLGVGHFVWSVSAIEVSGGEILARSPEETAFFTVIHSQPLPPPVVHRPVLE